MNDIFFTVFSRHPKRGWLAPHMAASDRLRLYQMLGLPRTDATEEEIKRAFRRMSLRHHPDRNPHDDTATHRFQEVVLAYEVLSCPQKRRIYDWYGERGLRMYETYRAYASADGDTTSEKLQLQPLSLIHLLCCCASFIILIITVTFVKLFMKLSGNADDSLVILLAPLWLLGILFSASICFVTIRSPATRSRLSGLTVKVACLTAMMILLSSIADGIFSLSYVIACVPMYIFEGIALFRLLYKWRSRTYGVDASQGVLSPACHDLFRALARSLFLVLVPMRLDGVLSSSWFIISLPVWLLSILEVVEALATVITTAHNGTEAAAVAKQWACLRLSLIVAASIFAILVLLRLDGFITTWTPIFVPLFALLSIYFCCCACACTLYFALPAPRPRDVPPPIHTAPYFMAASSLERTPLLPQDQHTSSRGTAAPPLFGGEGLAAEV